MIIRSAVEKDIMNVSVLHQNFIKTGFLSSLGLSFLKLLYGVMVKSSNAVCLVAVEGAEVVGFVSGTGNVKAFYKEFFRKKFIQAVFVMIPKVIKPGVIKKVLETAFYPVKENEVLPQAELISIVVKEEFRGKAAAPQLFEALKDHFQSKKINKFKVVVGSYLGPTCRFYEKMGGHLTSEITIHRGEPYWVYTWDI